MYDREQYLIEQEMYLDELSHLFVKHNQHPDKKIVSDCVKRAISFASGKDYKVVSSELNKLKKFTKTTTYNMPKNYEYYLLHELDAKKLSGYHNIKVLDFAQDEPKGTYVITTRKHMTVVKDGKLYDTWNCGFKAICKVWKIPQALTQSRNLDLTKNKYFADVLKKVNKYLAKNGLK